MVRFEKTIFGYIEKNKNVFFVAIVSLLGLVLRIAAFNFESGDYQAWLKPWYDYFSQAGGLSGLSEQQGTYGIPYQFLIALMTYIPIKDIYLYKALSCVFDFLLAILVGLLVNHLLEKRKLLSFEFCLSYSAVLILPTVVLNSAVWAQCDVIYSFFGLLCIYYLYKEKYTPAYIFFGISLAYKMQAVFLFPFLVMHYIRTKKYHLNVFFYSLFAFLIMSVPGFIYGRDLLAPLRIYYHQSDFLPMMYANFPSFWALFKGDYYTLRVYAFCFTFVILGMALLWLIEKNELFTDKKNVLCILIWTVWTTLVFLPSMHERYGYLLNILLLVYAIYSMDKKIIFIFLLEQICTILTYCRYLFSIEYSFVLLVFFYIALYIVFSGTVYTSLLGKGKENQTP